MAEATNGNGEKLQKAAESIILQLASRWLVVVGFPAMFAVSVWFGNQIVGRFDDFIKESRATQAALDEKINAVDKEGSRQINALDVRMTGTERDVVYLRERIKP